MKESIEAENARLRVKKLLDTEDDQRKTRNRIKIEDLKDQFYLKRQTCDLKDYAL